jgi:hypothetical protein
MIILHFGEKKSIHSQFDASKIIIHILSTHPIKKKRNSFLKKYLITILNIIFIVLLIFLKLKLLKLLLFNADLKSFYHLKARFLFFIPKPLFSSDFISKTNSVIWITTVLIHFSSKDRISSFSPCRRNYSSVLQIQNMQMFINVLISNAVLFS